MTEPRALSEGDRIGGRYRIVRPLGQGGMANVFVAFDEETHVDVALKVMRSDLAGDPDFVRRFATEARAAASLDHPNIVRVLDYGQDDDIRYIIQEYVEGKTLKALIDQHGSLDYRLATPLAIQIALALEHAHQREVIHRDIKPQNILITNDMVAKVTDFGIARAANASSITLTGEMVMGSVHYFSPEQARNGVITARSDLYSLGIVFYEMLTGRLPFDGDSSVAVAIKHLQDAPMPPTSVNPSLPPAIDRIMNRMLAKNPDVRYASARELINELDAFMVEPNGVYGVMPKVTTHVDSQRLTALANGSAKAMHTIDPAYGARSHMRRRDRILIISVVAVAIVILAVIALWLTERFGSPHNDDTQDVTLPNFVGRTLSDILPELDRLQSLGLRYRRVSQANDTVDPGVVFRQEPASDGTLKVKRSTELVLYVSLGQNQVAVPDVLGMTREMAEQTLRAKGLKINWRQEVSNDHAQNTVIRTTPDAHTTVNVGDPVEVVLSMGTATTRVPNVVRYSYYDAVYMLERANLKVGNVRVITGGRFDASSMFVIQQDRAADSEAPINTPINLVVGTAADLNHHFNPTTPAAATFRIPSFVGSKGPHAIRTLTSLGFSGEITAERVNRNVTFDINDPRAYIVAQDPEPGEPVAKANGTVRFRYGSKDDYDQSVNPTTPPTPPPTTAAPPTETEPEPTPNPTAVATTHG